MSCYKKIQKSDSIIVNIRGNVYNLFSVACFFIVHEHYEPEKLLQFFTDRFKENRSVGDSQTIWIPNGV